MADTNNTERAAPDTFRIDACEEAFIRDFCPYKGSPDPLVVWRAAWQSALAALAPSAGDEPVGEVESSLRFTGGFHARLYRDAQMPEPGAKLFTRPQPPEAREGWMPIETAPKDGRTLLLGCFNSRGNWRTMRGEWMSQAHIDEYVEDPDSMTPGWYETTVEDDEGKCWSVAPTHWMPLPPPPSGASKEVGNAEG